LAIALVTPFRSGELLKVELLKQEGLIGRSHGYGSFMVERLLDLFVVACFALYGLLFVLTSMFKSTKVTICWGMPLALVGIVTGYLIMKRVKPGGKLGHLFEHLGIYVRNPGVALILLVLTFCSWTLVALGWQMSLHSIGVTLPFVRVLVLTSLATIVNLLSCIPGAVGVSEVTIAEILIHMGVETRLAQSGALMVRTYGFLVILLGLIHWSRRIQETGVEQ